MGKHYRFLLLVTIILLAGCGATMSVKKDQSTYTPTMKLDAAFRIENWNTYESKGAWVVNIFFEMQNTGNVQIAYYEVYFSATCEDGSKCVGDGWGPYKSWEKAFEGEVGDPIYPGNKARGMGGIKACTSKPVSVKVTTWKLYQTR